MSWEKEIEELRRREALARRMGGARQDQAPARRRQAHRARAHRPAARQGSFHEIGAIAGKAEYDADGDLVDFTPSNFVMGRGRIDGRPVVVGGDDFTVRGGAADASIQREAGRRRSRWRTSSASRWCAWSTAPAAAARSRATRRPARPTCPRIPGWEHVVDNLAKVPVVALGLGSVAGLGAARLVTAHYSLMVTRHLADVRRRPAGRGAAGREGHQGGAGRHARSTPATARSTTRSRARTRPSPARGGSCPTCPPRSTSLRRAAAEQRRSQPPRGLADRRDPARPPQGLSHPADRRGLRRSRLASSRSASCGAARSSPASPGSTAGRSRCWRAIPSSMAAAGRPMPATRSTRFVDFAETFHLPVVHFVDIPGFMIGVAGEKAGTIRARRAGAGRGLPGARRRGARSCCASRSASRARRTRTGRRTISATPGRRATGARCRSKAASRPPTRPSSPPRPIRRRISRRSRRGSTRCARPSARAERFGVEEIIDPRDTRQLLCEFANLAAPMRKPGPRSFGYRP